MNNLLKKYREKIRPQIMKEFNFTSIMQVPKISKVIVSQAMGDISKNNQFVKTAFEELALITGQTPVKTIAKKSIAAFKVREGQIMGAKVTLRGQKMYYFLDKLFNTSLSRVRDFRGLSPKAFDGQGNYTIGIKEQLVFPEIHYDKVKKVKGLDIIIVTSGQSDEHSFQLLKLMGCPFKSS